MYRGREAIPGRLVLSSNGCAPLLKPEHYGQPATTPYAIADWSCRCILPPGSVLLDPFVGSGTTLAAGLDDGTSKFIGIDKEVKYLKMAAKRIKAG